MGINGSEFNYWNYASGCSDYYRTMASTYLDLSSYNRSYLWGARYATAALNNWTLCAGAPYSKMTVFPGGRAYFTVGDASRYSFGGGRTYSHADIQAVVSTHAANASVRAYSTQIGAKWHLVRSLSFLLKPENVKFLSEDSKAEIESYVKQAKEALEELDTLLKNENGLSADELNEILAGKLADVEAVVEVTNERNQEWIEEIKEAQEARRDELLDEAETGAGGSSGSGRSGSGSASGTAPGKKVNADELSSDTELSEVTKSRYGMLPTASVQACENASELAGKAVEDTLTTADAFLELFGKDKDINEKNIVEVLNEFNVDETVTIDGSEVTRSKLHNFVDMIAALKDGEGDYSTKALKEVIKLLKARVTLLNNAGHIKPEEKTLVDAHITNLTNYASNVKGNKDAIVNTLTEIINKLERKGTEEVVNADIEAKQTEAKELAEKEFRQAYAEASDGTYSEDTTYVDFPSEIKYLPNKKLFQVTITVGSGTYYFEGGNFTNINKAITDCGIDDVFTKWQEIKGKLLEEPAPETE